MRFAVGGSGSVMEVLQVAFEIVKSRSREFHEIRSKSFHSFRSVSSAYEWLSACT
jgi:hypothetical protein